MNGLTHEETKAPTEIDDSLHQIRMEMDQWRRAGHQWGASDLILDRLADFQIRIERIEENHRSRLQFWQESAQRYMFGPKPQDLLLGAAMSGGDTEKLLHQLAPKEDK